MKNNVLIYNVISNKSPIGRKGERVVELLSDMQTEFAKESERLGHIEIMLHTRNDAR